MRRLFAILVLAAAGLFAACNDPAGSPGVPGDTTAPTDMPVESVEPTVEP
jgi:hypothetical protein